MKRLWYALLHSLSGIKAAYKDEAAFRQEAWLAVILVPAGFILAPDTVSVILMETSIILVLIIELLNTAVESAIDRIGPERHPLSKKAKDTASAAVLLSLINLFMVWALILI